MPWPSLKGAEKSRGDRQESPVRAPAAVKILPDLDAN